jgi:hypothetical protein
MIARRFMMGTSPRRLSEIRATQGYAVKMAARMWGFGAETRPPLRFSCSAAVYGLRPASGLLQPIAMRLWPLLFFLFGCASYEGVMANPAELFVATDSSEQTLHLDPIEPGPF